MVGAARWCSVHSTTGLAVPGGAGAAGPKDSQDEKQSSTTVMPLLLEPKDVAEAIGVLYQCSPGQRFAIVHCACAEDAEYYSTWVGTPSACSLACAVPLISWCLTVP